MQDSWGYLCTVVVVSASSQQVFWKISHLSSFPLKGTNYRIYQKKFKILENPTCYNHCPYSPFLPNLSLKHLKFAVTTLPLCQWNKSICTLYHLFQNDWLQYKAPFQGTVYILYHFGAIQLQLVSGIGLGNIIILYIGLLWELMKKRISDVCKQMAHNLHFLCWKASYKANSSSHKEVQFPQSTQCVPLWDDKFREILGQYCFYSSQCLVA